MVVASDDSQRMKFYLIYDRIILLLLLIKHRKLEFNVLNALFFEMIFQ